MAAPTETYIDPLAGATNGNDHGGNAFVDGSFVNATLTLTKIGAFTAATCQAGDKIYLDDNGSGEVTPGLYTINARVDNDNVTLTADIRSGINDPSDVRCDQHTGAVGLPWATIQHAADFTTQGASGDRFNIRDTADDVLAAAMDWSTYGGPSFTKPLIIQGYTTAAGDGGIGGISGGGAVGMFASSSLDDVTIIDMHMHDCGAAAIISLDDDIRLYNVELDNTTGMGITVNDDAYLWNVYSHNVGAYGIDTGSAGRVLFCVVENGVNDVSRAINVSTNSEVQNCIVSVDSSSDGIVVGFACRVENNSVYSAAGTGQGIIIGSRGGTLLNNIVEGFSGVGGIGYDINADLNLYGHNSAYNNTTNFDVLAGTMQCLDLGNNTVLGSSAFTNPGAGNFEVGTDVKAGGWPEDFQGLATDTFIDEGAAQREEAGGGAAPICSPSAITR